MPSAPATQAAIQRAISAVKAQGLAIGAVVVARDGTIRIETHAPQAAASESLDAPPAPVQDLQPKRWARR
jgi:hypothetical protein